MPAIFPAPAQNPTPTGTVTLTPAQLDQLVSAGYQGTFPPGGRFTYFAQDSAENKPFSFPSNTYLSSSGNPATDASPGMTIGQYFGLNGQNPQPNPLPTQMAPVASNNTISNSNAGAPGSSSFVPFVPNAGTVLPSVMQPTYSPQPAALVPQATTANIDPATLALMQQISNTYGGAQP